MTLKYSCPHCTAVLNPGVKIVLLGRYQGTDALIAFHPEPGNYEKAAPDHGFIKDGEVWEFFCPVCHHSLNYAQGGGKNLAALEMVDGAGNWHKVIFSRVAGEEKTMTITMSQEIESDAQSMNVSKQECCLWEKYI